MKTLIETPEFFLWSEVILLWSVVAYGISSDPLPENSGSETFLWKRWRAIAIVRTICLFGLILLISGSLNLSLWILLVAIVQPWLRYKTPNRWTAEIETGTVFVTLVGTLMFIRYFELSARRGIHVPLTAEQISAICITATTVLFVVRGGTYIVRGCLRKSKTLPKIKHPKLKKKKVSVVETDAEAMDQTGASIRVSRIEVAKDEEEYEAEETDDMEEIKRGRLIGNLERLLLTLVVAAGSYAALAFLIAAKGLIRSNELQERNFAEYFLVGSLSSVLVSLCAGIALRFAVLALWPALLSLQMQGS